jgi:resuscitation-promoting factor RpfB
MKPWQRIGSIGGALLLSCCGGLLGIGLLAGDPKTETVGGTPEALTGATAAASASASAGETVAEPVLDDVVPSPSDAGPTTEAPAVTKRTAKETKSIRYGTRRVDDDSLAEGRTKVRVKGVNGVRTITYEVTLTDGQETARKQVSSVVTRKPVTQVIAVGTKQAGNGCDPNYTPCVPIASDVDCAGGSGNGPAYVEGPIQVIGSDPYDLDRDGDGVACDT